VAKEKNSDEVLVTSVKSYMFYHYIIGEEAGGSDKCHQMEANLAFFVPSTNKKAR